MRRRGREKERERNGVARLKHVQLGRGRARSRREETARSTVWGEKERERMSLMNEGGERRLCRQTAENEKCYRKTTDFYSGSETGRTDD